MVNYLRMNFISKITLWIFLVLIWYMISYILSSSIILPYPHTVFLEAIRLILNLNFIKHLSISLSRSIAGFLLSLSLGFLLGLVNSRFLYKGIRSIIDIFQSNPLIVWITLALVWFGFGTSVVIFTVFIMLFPNFYLQVYHAIKNIPNKYRELFLVYPLDKKSYLVKFLFPYLKPYLLPVFANSLLSSFKITAMAEFFSANNGIGFLLSYSKTFLNTKEIYAYALYLFLISKFLEFIFIRLKILERDDVK